MIDPFFLIGAMIIIGFFASLFFERTKIPDILILIFLGMLVGPVFHVVDTTPGSTVVAFAPYVGVLALIIILFEGGMGMNLFQVMRELPKAGGFTILVFILTVTFSSVFMHFVYGWQWLYGALLGIVLSDTSEIVVLSILPKLSVGERPRAILSLESTLTDVLVVVGGITMIQIIGAGSIDVSAIANTLFGSFSIAAMLAIIAAIVWIVILRKFYGKSFGYLLTLAVTFIIYSFVESVGANGAIAIFIFALLLGNFTELAKLLKIPGEFRLDNALKAFHEEVSFFVRTFFFVYVGLLFDPATVTQNVFVIGISLLIIIYLARGLSVYSLQRAVPEIAPYTQLMTTMMPRGLAAAVMATVPASRGINIPNFVELVFLIIILTNIITTIGVFTYERRKTNDTVEKTSRKPNKS